MSNSKIAGINLTNLKNKLENVMKASNNNTKKASEKFINKAIENAMQYTNNLPKPIKEHFQSSLLENTIDTIKKSTNRISNSGNSNIGVKENFSGNNMGTAIANPLGTAIDAIKNSEKFKNKTASGAIGTIVGIGIFIIIVALAVLIIGIVWAFQCGFTLVGILGIVGLILGLFGLPVNIGLAFFIIYLTAKNRICGAV